MSEKIPDGLGLRKARMFADSFTVKRFGTAPKAKFNRKLFNDDLRAAYISGELVMGEIILQRHKEKPYATVEEVMGDIQVLSMKYYNYYSSKLTGHRLKKINLDHFIKEEELVETQAIAVSPEVYQKFLEAVEEGKI